MSASSTLSGWIERDSLLREARMTALGIRHGFSTRRTGDMKDAALRSLAARALGLSDPLTLKQVHGTVIHEARSQNSGRDGDGWIVSDPGVAVAIYVADCVPLFLWSDDGKTAGVFHAGWRGMAAGMAQAAVAALRGRGVAAARLFAAIGPHIRPCCYRVGADLVERFPAASFVYRDGAAFLDLAAETHRQLIEAGVPERNIGEPAPCTATRAEDFFSYRRDKVDARQCAFLSLAP